MGHLEEFHNDDVLLVDINSKEAIKKNPFDFSQQIKSKKGSK